MVESFDYIFYLHFVFVFWIGLVLGSFATAVLYREAIGISWYSIKPQSHQRFSSCPNCKTQLKAIDLVPLFSWLFQGGKCRYCSWKIPARYPVIESVNCLLCLCVFWFAGLSVQSVFLMAMVPFLLVFLGLYQDHKIVSLPLLAIGFMFGAISFVLHLSL